jgi:hypothetical protein
MRFVEKAQLISEKTDLVADLARVTNQRPLQPSVSALRKRKFEQDSDDKGPTQQPRDVLLILMDESVTEISTSPSRALVHSISE